MATLLILGARAAQLPLIRAAKQDRLAVVTIDPDSKAAGHALADSSYSYDLADMSACLEVARKHRVNGVVTLGADYPMPTLASICAELALPGPSPEATRKATDKVAMRKALGAPRYREVQNEDEARAAAAQLNCAVIMKPAVSSGGRGVTRLSSDTRNEVIDAAFERAQRHSRNGAAIVEEYIDGPEFSVETITSGGKTHVLAITDKETSGPPYFVEIAHRQPSAFGDAEKSSLAMAAIQGIERLGIDNAPGHAEIRLSPNGPVIMEIAARMGGGFIASHLVQLSTGTDMVRAAIAVALGREPDLDPVHDAGAASRFLCPRPGRLLSVEGLDEVQNDPACVDASLYVSPGDTIAPLTDATSRAGHVICKANTGDAAAAAASRLADMVHFDIACS